MWSAFMNGTGLHGGGGAGGGNVPSQGWEFVPRSRMERAERGRGKNRSPLRRVSSPPTVFSQAQEPQFGASTSGGEDGAGAQILEILRGQMWPGPEPQQQPQQTQHSRFKKKFEDLKKRHVQDKEEWMREKESLLREVADIQGGENRRILLDLKTILEEVQAEVKREEEKRSELQLQYTRDRCAWQLEKAELKCRIAQLEAREATGLVSGGLQSAAGLGSVASRSPGELHGETSTFRREKEEQRRILVDTHTTAMDLRYRFEHNERDWLREKAELLERFDVERKEWESQLKDMQHKIEELYCEVRVKRGGTGQDRRKRDDDGVHRLSLRSTSTGSSLLSDNSHSDLLSSSTQSEPTRHPPSPGFDHYRNIRDDDAFVNRDSHPSACFQADSLCGFNVGGQFSQSEHLQPELDDELRCRGTRQQDSVTANKEAVDTTELDAVNHGTPGCGVQQDYASEGTEKGVQVSPQEGTLLGGLNYSSDKKKNTALNAALKEIARVSEELCSYQDEIRKKSGDKRSQSESLCLSEGSEKLHGHDKNCLQVDEAPCDLSQIYDDLRALEREHWLTLSPGNTWKADRGPSESWTTNTDERDSCRATQTSPGVHSDIDTAAPPIPPRTSSWNLSTPNLDTELHIPESPIGTVRRCHSPCVLVDRKCNSPSIVRKFEAMLQENEGKVFKDGFIISCSEPANSNCNMGCCHNRWSCDASKFTPNKLSTYGTVQKSFSEVNILSAGKDYSSQLHMSPSVRELPVELLLSSLEIPAVNPNLQGSRRNIMLEKKTAEFNRTLFQAEMGRGAHVQDGFTVTDTCSAACQPVLTTSDDILLLNETFQPICMDFTTTIMDAPPKVPLILSNSDSTTQNPEVLQKQMRCATEVKDFRVKSENRPVHSVEQLQAGLSKATRTSQSPAHHSEVDCKVRPESSPSRKSQHRAATEAFFSETVLPANPQPGQSVDDTSTQKEMIHGAKHLSARTSVSHQQSSTESKQRQLIQPRQCDSSRPAPRMLNDHPWKPLTLAAYPRPEGSRSNYGAVERILKNYESAARAQQNESQQNEMGSSPNFSCGRDESLTEVDMLDMDPLLLPPTLRHRQTSHNSQTHSSQVTAQVSSHSSKCLMEVQLIVQEDDEPSVSSSSVQKNFSRPARPANRRLPSRWASRSPTSSSSASSSPCTTPVTPPSFPLQKHASSFTYSHDFHIETVII
ncbi:uncharacterized protein KIAA0408-like isoform 1-T1 [Odontesthes bonariensis]|uniref:protein SOGA3a isoform X1 n=1 Tax=Odontesthes bonariensis TaxID=219752 RepID=UPI003F58F3B8